MSIFDLAVMNLPETTLLAIRDNALASISTGKVITSVNTPGLSTAFQVYANPLDILKAAQYALQMINPTIYGTPLQTSVQGFSR